MSLRTRWCTASSRAELVGFACRNNSDIMQTLSSHLSVTSRCPVICHNTQTVSRSYGVLPNLCRQKRRHAASSLTLPRCRPAQQAFSARKPLAGFVSSHPKRVQSSATATQAEPIAFTRPVEAEDCEEEDFYSILGVVRALQGGFTYPLTLLTLGMLTALTCG